MPSEFDFIDWIRAQTPSHPRVVIPPGDDLAALKWDGNDLLLCGADQVLDGVHFNSSIHSPRDIGRKAMNRNLSDCAAMACLPTAAIATVALPKGTSIDYLKELFLGMKEAGDKFDCPIVGGDTASWEGKLAISVSVIGRTGGIKPVGRHGAKPGDGIFVTGPLGGSLLGRHLTFEPKIECGRALASAGIRALIDLSDGLSRDLRHICDESSCGAIIWADKIPIHDDAIEMRRDGHTPLEHALHDGEDYELLFTGPIELTWYSQTAVGKMTSEQGIFLQHPDGRREPLEPKAWEHRF